MLLLLERRPITATEEDPGVKIRNKLTAPSCWSWSWTGASWLPMHPCHRQGSQKAGVLRPSVGCNPVLRQRLGHDGELIFSLRYLSVSTRSERAP